MSTSDRQCARFFTDQFVSQSNVHGFEQKTGEAYLFFWVTTTVDINLWLIWWLCYKNSSSYKMISSAFSQVLYLSTVLKYLYLIWVFLFYATLYFIYTTFYTTFILKLYSLVTLQIKIINTKYHQQINMISYYDKLQH